MPPAPAPDALARVIVDRLRPRRVVLFGGRARGDDAPGADIDPFVEMDSDLRPLERAAEVGALFGLRPWPAVVVVQRAAGLGGGG